jgi:LysR family hydrogen peroxide-inducible transcriptional activator
MPSDIDVNKVWLLEEGNCLRTQFENICHLRENSLKPKNLDFMASNINTLVHMVDKIGGLPFCQNWLFLNFRKDRKIKFIILKAFP